MMTKRAKKRVPGPGRKALPEGERKDEDFYARISAETSDALDAEAERQGRKRAAIAREALELGLGMMQGKRRSKPMESVLTVISRLAQEVSFENEQKERIDWRTSQTLRDLFSRSIDLLLIELGPQPTMGPKAEADSQETVDAIFDKLRQTLDIPQFALDRIKTADDWAEAIFAKVWFGVLASRPMAAEQAQVLFGLNSIDAMRLAADSVVSQEIRDDLKIYRNKEDKK